MSSTCPSNQLKCWKRTKQARAKPTVAVVGIVKADRAAVLYYEQHKSEDEAFAMGNLNTHQGSEQRVSSPDEQPSMWGHNSRGYRTIHQSQLRDSGISSKRE